MLVFDESISEDNRRVITWMMTKLSSLGVPLKTYVTKEVTYTFDVSGDDILVTSKRK